MYSLIIQLFLDIVKQVLQYLTISIRSQNCAHDAVYYLE